MMRALVVACVCATALLPASAAAEAAAPKPGSCEVVPGARGIRRCFPVGAVGQFTAHVSGGSTLLVEFDEPILDFLRPSKRYFSSKRLSPRSIALRPLARTWPEYASALIKTRTMSITLSFAAVPAARADAQLHIMRLDRRQADADVERRVKAARARLQADFKAKLARLDRRAAAMSERNITRWLLAGGADIRTPRGRRRTYRRHIVIKTRKRIRIGKRTYLVFTVRNQHESLLSFGRPQVTGGTQPARALCTTDRLRAGQTARCVAHVGTGLDPSARLSITVRETRGDRKAVLRGIDVR